MNVKPSKPGKFRLARSIAGALILAACGPAPDPGPPPPSHLAPVDAGGEPAAYAASVAPATDRRESCDAPAYVEAARANRQSLRTLAWAPFRREEIGWETYAPLIGQQIGTACAPDSERFAVALADWQTTHRLTADGVLTPETFAAMKNRVEMRRPFVVLSAKGTCPPPPPAGNLMAATTAEGYSGKAVQLRPAALDAYRRMVAAARAASPRIAADHRNLTIFSAYRSPEDDAARCELEQNCDGVVRAGCSPHRTGLAVDLFVGAAPGHGPDSTADPNRLFQSKGATYRWMLANAERFGFANYPFEPWHWEWVGEEP